MQTAHNIKLTSAEIAHLWINYINDSLSTCVLRYMFEKTEDTQMKEIIGFALQLSQKHVETIKEMFEHENYPIPLGFTNEDVSLKAPRLFSDMFHIQYVFHMTKIGIPSYGVSLGMVSRSDVRAYFSECIASSTELQNKTVDLLLEKGLLVRPPYITTPKKVDFVKDQSFLKGWFGERKPLLSMEIAQLWHNIQTNEIGKALVMGFSQVAKTADVRDYMVRGKKISAKHIEIFGSLLTDNDLPSPVSSDADVTDATIPPFSDKLMLFHASALSAAGMGNYGAAIATSTRRDLVAHYLRLNAEIGQYAEDGANLMIKHGWMEQPPQSVDREELARK
ncbi:DUF3231 family protein [Ammoniphilus resinae]|uniref:DUF3231 family protein n=1 Tax=Ammoniphilus resinae TaxID=861532 RepID=A0ABS4GQ38_9BACL|nr:DUF3231 family protein [Ammoniphilus resinae]MBP1932385.1 hypothetical protein [Ammoniphilus resinae]